MLHDRIQKTLSESNLKWDLTPHHRRQRRGAHPRSQMEELRGWCVKGLAPWERTSEKHSLDSEPISTLRSCTYSQATAAIHILRVRTFLI